MYKTVYKKTCFGAFPETFLSQKHLFDRDELKIINRVHKNMNLDEGSHNVPIY